MTVKKRCAKCDHEAWVSDDSSAACPSCGAIYAKLEQMSPELLAALRARASSAKLKAEATDNNPQSMVSVKKSQEAALGGWMLLIVVGFLAWQFLGQSGSDAPVRRSVVATPAIAAKFTVSYVVTGSASAVDLTFNNETGGTEQHKSLSLPWQKDFEAQLGEFLYISAQNEGRSGDVEVKILANGVLISSSKASGAYTIATASERCCA